RGLGGEVNGQVIKNPFLKQDIKLPEYLEGFDIKTALKRVNYNKRLLLELLTGFYKKYAMINREIREAISQDDFDLAADITHTVKGFAGNISAIYVYNSANELESALREGNIEALDVDIEQNKNRNNYDDLLSNFDTALHNALESLKFIEDKNQNKINGANIEIEKKNIEHEKIKPLIIELYELIETYNSDALSSLYNLKQYIDVPILFEEINIIEDQLNNFDFINALDTLQNIAKKIDISL
ncbi:MAG: Hpt domain-containing protein, partial [Desulfamplus sp.]|nr:Hpt domain-containing protein [Desulfamplus sp.]